MLEVKNIYKSYNNDKYRLPVLKGINLNIKKEEFVAIQGPSGAGKSTLLHILGGLDYPSSGEVVFESTNLYKLSDHERSIFRNKKAGFVFQFYHLLPELNVLENVILPSLLKSWAERKKATHRASLILDSLGLTSRLTHRPNQLSGGEQQRVAVARALINKPQIIFCDEPTGNLDSENGKNILNLLRGLNKKENVTIVMVTHDKDIAAQADRVVHLKDGIILN